MAGKEMIGAADLGLSENLLEDAPSIGGVRVADVGQGDAICILDDDKRPLMWIDYGGYQSSPFKAMTATVRVPAVDLALPAGTIPIMLTHWDEDHWASAVPGTQAVEASQWLVPRQWTSPSAVRLSTQIKHIRCIPPSLEHGPVCFVAANGDQLWWEKLKPFRRHGHSEDCNRTGVAFSIVKATSRQVIFLPGDAPFHLPQHYADHARDGLQMRGLVAFHHGAGTHWARKTRDFLDKWRQVSVPQVIVYSFGDPNRDQHPVETNYQSAFPPAFYKKVEVKRTPQSREGPTQPIEILF